MVAVAIDDDSGESVGFAPYQTRQQGIDVQGGSIINSLLDSAVEKLLIELLRSAGESAGDDLGIGIVDSGAQGAILEVFQRNNIARLRVSEGLLDFARVDPLVTVENPSAGFDNQAWHGGREG